MAMRHGLCQLYRLRLRSGSRVSLFGNEISRVLLLETESYLGEAKVKPIHIKMCPVFRFLKTKAI